MGDGKTVSEGPIAKIPLVRADGAIGVISAGGAHRDVIAQRDGKVRARIGHRSHISDNIPIL